MSTEKEPKGQPCIIVYGDSDDKRISKELWALLSDQGLKLLNPDSVAAVEAHIRDALIVFICMADQHDQNIEIPKILKRKPKLAAEIIGIAPESGIEERTKLLAQGFDLVINPSFFQIPEMKTVFINRLDEAWKRMESRVENEEYKRFRAALAASPDAFIVFDENNRLFFVSEHYKNAYPENSEQLVRGMAVTDAFELLSSEQLSKDDPRYHEMRAFWEKLEGQKEFSLDDGRTWRVKAARLPGGQGTIVTTTDITDYINQQAELEEKSERLRVALEKEQEASAIQKQFINMISHEFRTPLAIIDGNAQIIQRRGTALSTEDMAKKTRIIRSAVSRLLNMMEGVLSSNMLRTGNLELTYESLNIRNMVRDMCEEHAELSSGLTLEADIERLPDEAKLDRKVVALVMTNLLSNAVKFSRDDPHIQVAGFVDGDRIVIGVQDNGIGIPANEVDQVFERYYRTSTANGIPGSGIGLNLVKDLITLHQGDIRVDSVEGEGTKVVFELPFEA